jgi:aryl-alcohol dehydrogenase-like predicted oxidoreductase
VAIRRALAHGANWIDAAAIYGLGHSEEVVGRALAGIPLSERRYVFTKCGLIPDRSRPFEMPKRNLRPESIRREVEASLKWLGVERIDLLSVSLA